MLSVLYGNVTESIERNHVSVSVRNCSTRLFMSFSTASAFLDNPRIFKVPLGIHPRICTSPLLELSILIERVGFGFFCIHSFNRWGAILPGNFGPTLFFFFFFCPCFISRFELLK